MYLNFDLIYKQELTSEDIFNLLKLRQKETELVLWDSKSIKKLIAEEYITEKGGLTKKTKELLLQLTTPPVDESITKFTEQLIEVYKNEGAALGNKIKLVNIVNWFVRTTGFKLESILETIQEYLQENREYTMQLNNLFWKPANVFSVNYTLGESRLFNIMADKYRIDFDKIKSESGKVGYNYLKAVATLKIPKRAEADMYFTKSAKGDLEAQARLKKKFYQLIKK